MKEFYLDDNSTTKTRKEVIEAVNETMISDFGNPSSLHKKGEEAMSLITRSRRKIATTIGAKPWEIYFTSGGTESDNWALRGIALKNPGKKKIVISAIEHAAIMETCEEMKKEGYEIIKIGVDKSGIVDFEMLEKVLSVDSKEILLVSVIHVNNIFGTIQDLQKIGKLCKENKVTFHTDAVQSFGKLRIDVEKFSVDLLSASGHKIGGPKGIGLLYLREGVKINPLILGGGQERDLRSGTENVPGIVGFAKAVEIIEKENTEKINEVRDYFIEKLENIGGVINGARGDERIQGNVHVSFSGIDNDSLIVALSERGIFASAGSACDSKKDKEDYVLKSLGIEERLISGSVRFSFSSEIEKADIDYIVSEIDNIIKLRLE